MPLQRHKRKTNVPAVSVCFEITSYSLRVFVTCSLMMSGATFESSHTQTLSSISPVHVSFLDSVCDVYVLRKPPNTRLISVAGT